MENYFVANTAQARKRARQAERNRERNVGQRSHMRTLVKRVINLAEGNDKDGAKTALDNAIPALDKAARKGLIHANKAARIKSRLTKKVKAL